MNMNEWVKTQIENKKRITIPIMTHPGIEMIGRTVKEAVQNGEIHAQAIQKLSETYPSAATTVIMDLTVEAEAFGCQIEFPENDMPHILGRLVSNAEEIDNLKVPDLATGRIAQYLKANEITVKNIKDKPVLAGIIGPFSLAGRLYDLSEIMMACYIEPESIQTLLRKCTEFIISYCVAFKEIGCSGVVIAEPAAGLLSNDDCQLFSTEYVKMVVDALQDDQFMVILHNCGNKGHCTEAMLNSGAAGFHFGNAIDMVETLQACPKEKLIMGNIDPAGVMKMKTPAEIKEIVSELLTKTAEFKNFVLSTGCDLPPHVAPENIDAYYSALDEFNSI